MAGFVLYQYEPGPTFNYVGMVASLPEVLNEMVYVFLPDGVQIDTDVGTDIVSVITQKRNALAAAYGYVNAFSSEFNVVSDIDSAYVGTRASVSVGFNTYLLPEDGSANPGQMTTNAEVAPGSVTDYVLLWDVRELTLEDSRAAELAVGDRAARYLPSTVDPDDIIARVSADGGATWDDVTHGTPAVPSSPGASIRVQFETKPAETRKLRIGGFYLFYNTV